MYHHHLQQQQSSQPFDNGPRPPHQQHQNLTGPATMSQGMGFSFHRPTQLPDELESALAIRGARDMDHRLIEQMNQPAQHQNQCSISGSGQRGSFGSDLVQLTSDNQPDHQQGVDWSGYQNATERFSSSHPSTGHQAQHLHGPSQQSKSSHTGARIPNWPSAVSDSSARNLHGGGGDGQGSYTAESAGSILASFGLSNEDLEVLSHYPDDQLTPDTLPFILRDIQINKTSNQKVSYPGRAPSSSFSHNNPDLKLTSSRLSPLPSSRPPDLPGFLTVTQTTGKVIDYGHASRAKEDSDIRETFKRERLSGERMAKMYPTSSPPPQNFPRVDKVERHQLPLARAEISKHGDRDYRKANDNQRRSHRSPAREFSPLSKHRNVDRDYRREGPKPRISSDTDSETSSRRSLSSSSGSKQLRSSSKKLPPATMINDFSAATPKGYPHTCSLCRVECNQEKDWVDHINTVNHTAACRELRNKYPDWKPDPSSRSGRYDTWHHWDPKDGSPSRPASRPISRSHSPSPPHGRHRTEPHLHRPQERSYSPLDNRNYHHHEAGSSCDTVKRPFDHSSKFSSDAGRHPSKASHGSKPVPAAPTHTKSPKSRAKPRGKVATAASPSKTFNKSPKSGTKPGVKVATATTPTKTLNKSPKSGTKPGVKVAAASSQNPTKPPKSGTKSEALVAAAAASVQTLTKMPKSGTKSEALVAAAAASVQTLTKLPKSGTKPGANVAKTGNAKTTETSAKPPSAKKKKVEPVASQDSSFACPLEDLTGIPEDMEEQEVTAQAGSFGKIDDVVLVPSLEANDSKPAGQQASVCMMKTEDAQDVTSSTSLSISELPVTSTIAEPEMEPSTENKSSKQAAEKDAGGAKPMAPAQEGLVLISGLADSGWSESDVVRLVEPFGTASNIIIATELGKVLVTVPDVDIAKEMVKVNNFMPIKMGDNKLVMTQLKQPIGLGTPVALYNLLMGSADHPENFSPVAWNTLLVIQNVPSTPTGPSEVMKLVRRFGTVIKALVLNGLVICEMATEAVAVAVQKRFKTFPCIIHNNPLFFTRKPDPKPSGQSRDGPKHKEPPEGRRAAKRKKPPAPFKGKVTKEKVSKTPAERPAEDGARPVEVEKSGASVSAGPAAAAVVVHDPAEEEKKESDSEKPAAVEATETEQQQPQQPQQQQQPQQPQQPQQQQQQQQQQQEEKEEEEDRGSKQEPDESSAGGEMKSPDVVDTAAPDPPQQDKKEEENEAEKQMDQETSAPPDQSQTAEAEQSVRASKKKAELIQKEEREKERRSKERREREEKARRERERREEERARRERERRKRPHEEESRSKSRKSSRREEPQSRKIVEEQQQQQQQQEQVEEEEDEEFPFNMSDFVTVDEVGDVTDLPGSSGPASLAVPREATPPPELHHPSKDTVGLATTPSESGGRTAPSAGTLEELPSADVTAAESSHVQVEASQTVALESRTSDTQQALDPAPQPVLDPAMDPAAGPAADSVPPPGPAPSPPPQTTCAAPEPSDAASCEGPGGAPTAATDLPVGASDGVSSAVPAGASHGASVARGAPDGPHHQEPPRVPRKSPTRVADRAPGNTASQAPLSELEMTSGGRHPTAASAPETVKNKTSGKKEVTLSRTPTCSLPPYDPHKPIGLNLLVPKTGFYCKACNRFFCGGKQAEINHCKTLKHYENLQKYLQTEVKEGS